jgi:hypothetical protein
MVTLAFNRQNGKWSATACVNAGRAQWPSGPPRQSLSEMDFPLRCQLSPSPSRTDQCVGDQYRWRKNRPPSAVKNVS